MKLARTQKNILRTIALSVIVLPLLLAFQNCTPSQTFEGRTTSQMSPGNGNGDFYGGKPILYSHFAADSCRETGRDGKPLPNSQILAPKAGQYKLVRSDCADLNAIDLSPSSVQVTGNDVVYEGRSYALATIKDDFSVIAANCPAGRTLKPSASRVNLIPNAQNMLDTSTWWNHEGVLTSLSDTLAGLPAFTIRRNDPTRLDYWRRAHPDLTLAPNKTYAVSFLARAGTVGEMYFSTSQGSSVISAAVDIATGSTRVFEQQQITLISSESRTIGSSRYYTLFISTAAALPQIPGAFGFGPNGLDAGSNDVSRVGDSVIISTPQLEDVASYCD